MESNKKLIVAAGCFWGVQKYYSLVRGVLSTTCGYVGGNLKNPTYEDICTGETNHAEAVLIEYDSKKTNLKKLLDHYFFITDPTTPNQQQNDIGTQYRSVLYYNNEEEKEIIQKYIEQVQKKYEDKIVTEVSPVAQFWTAEEYHQMYLDKNPSGYCHLTSKHFKLVEEVDNI